MATPNQSLVLIERFEPSQETCLGMIIVYHQIDFLVYESYGLFDEETQIVGGKK
jgi:hypothetical protein